MFATSTKTATFLLTQDSCALRWRASAYGDARTDLIEAGPDDVLGVIPRTEAFPCGFGGALSKSAPKMTSRAAAAPTDTGSATRSPGEPRRRSERAAPGDRRILGRTSARTRPGALGRLA